MSKLDRFSELLPFFVREKEQLKVLSLDPSQNDPSLDVQESLLALPTPKVSAWSPDGQLIALADLNNGVQVVQYAKACAGKLEAADGEHPGVQTLPGSSKTVQTLLWSPDSKVLVTFSPAVKSKDLQLTGSEANVVAFAIDSQAANGDGGHLKITQLASFFYPKLEKDKKIFQWTPQSDLCARLCQDGTLQITQGNDLGGEVLTELAFSLAVQDFEFAPMAGPNEAIKNRLAVFVPDVRDDMQRVVGPAEVTIWELRCTGTGDDLVVSPNRLAVCSVSAGQIAEMEWSHNGSALIAHCQTEVDETGTSYYGGSKLMLLSPDGKYQIDLTESQEGNPSGTSVQAVQWSPAEDEFILIRGFQPAQAQLWSWDAAAQKAILVKVLLEKAHRNTIRFNHFGSLVCLAGFGNLAGDVDFFGRRQAGDKYDFAKISSCQANCTVTAEWARDGRHFLTAVLAPRMRVDNMVGVWRALEGRKVSEAQFEELFDAKWRPDKDDNGGRRPCLPITREEIEQAIKDHAAGTGAAAPKKQAYRPPKARGETGGNVGAMMRGEMAPDPMDDRRRKPRDPLRPPVRRDEGAIESPRPDEEKTRKDSGKDDPTASPPVPGPKGAARPPPPDVAVPSPPPPKNPSFYNQQTASGYPQQPAKATPVPKAVVAPPQPVPRKAPQQQPQAAMNQQPWQPKAAGMRGMEAQAPPGRDGQAHGEKLPCPSSGWQYVDPKQNIQGPFTLLEMQQWHGMGYFRANLPMRCDQADRFTSFGELFPHPMIPFQSYPKRPMGMPGMR